MPGSGDRSDGDLNRSAATDPRRDTAAHAGLQHDDRTSRIRTQPKYLRTAADHRDDRRLGQHHRANGQPLRNLRFLPLLPSAGGSQGEGEAPQAQLPSPAQHSKRTSTMQRCGHTTARHRPHRAAHGKLRWRLRHAQTAAAQVPTAVRSCASGCDARCLTPELALCLGLDRIHLWMCILWCNAYQHRDRRCPFWSRPKS